MDQGNRLSYLDALRGAAILLVVGGHASGYVFPSGDFQLGLLKGLWTNLFGPAVPIFFMVDGFLAARSRSRPFPPSFKELATKGFHRLMIPWFIFTILYVGMRIVFERKGLFSTQLLVGRPLGEALDNIFQSRVAMQLYFLPALLLIRLAAFPLGLDVRKHPAYFAGLWIGWILLIRLAGVQLQGDPISNALIGFQYFLFGALICRLEALPSGRWVPLLVGLSIAAILSKEISDQPIPGDRYIEYRKYGILTLGYFLAKWLERWSQGRSPMAWIGRRTMEIYLLHAPVLMKVAQLVVAKFVGGSIVQFYLIWVICVTVPLAFAKLTERNALVRRIFGVA